VHKLSIPHDALVLVADGRKALFLRNKGDAKYPNLIAEQVFIDDNPPTREQGTDRPGRAFKRAGTNRRSGVETTDWHEIGKQRFAVQVATALARLVQAQNVKSIVLAAPPRTLAELRHAFHPDVRERVLAEIDNDLTKHPIAEIERHLVGAP
jgi:protein required for attachment to host cells